MLLKLVLFFVCLYPTCLAAVVKTPLGKIEGWSSVSRDGRPYDAFTSVPYAKPPIGKLRLRNPEPVKKWSGIYNATGDSPRCTQLDMFAQLANVEAKSLGQEDCLYLNVYVPETKKEKLPVLAYIHGGAFLYGYPGPRNIADYFMDEDVILVTIIYRLGALGFLSMEDKNFNGNMGLKDQAAALDWIFANIASFGGDPDSVTVFGESAGGASAHFQMHTGKPLKGGISQSGTVNPFWSVARIGEMKNKTVTIAASFDCPTVCQKSMLDCLQEQDAEALTKTQSLLKEINKEDSVMFKPVIETKTSWSLINAKHLNQKISIPWIAGFNAGEELLRTIPLRLTDVSYIEEYKNNFHDYTAKTFNMDPELPKTKEITEKIKLHYFLKWDVINMIEQLGQLFEDGLFIYPALKAAKNSNGPVYVYHFEHRGEKTLWDKIFHVNTSEPSHADEIISLFNRSDEYGEMKSPKDIEVSKRLVKMWSHFAKNGNPGSFWPEYKSSNKILRITTEGNVISDDMWEDTFKFWNSLFDQIKDEL